MADDVNDRLRAFLATEPGSLGLADKLKQLEDENAALEAELDRVQKNRDAILREKRMLQGKPDKALRGTATELFITASESRDPARYREMREAAEKSGERLRIVDDGDTIKGPPQASPVRYVGDKEAGTLYINAAIRDRVGVQRVQEIAREQGYKEARTFRSTRDLPDHLQRQHQQTLLDREPGSLLEGDA